MAKNYIDIQNSIKAGNIMDWTNALQRKMGVPVDITEVYNSYNEAVKYAAADPVAYESQIIGVIENGDSTAYIITPKKQGEITIGEGDDAVIYDVYIKPIGGIPTGDGKTIEVAEDGKVSIYGSDEADSLAFPRMNQEQTHIEWVPTSEVVDNYTISKLDNTTSEGIIGHYYLDKNGKHVAGSDFKIPDFVTINIDEDGNKEHNSVKCYTFKQGNKLIGHIDIPTDLVVQSGSVIVATNEDKALDEAVIVGETYLKLVIAHQEKPIYILTKDLINTDFDVVDNGTGKFITDVTYVNNKLTITRSDVVWNNITEKPNLVNSVKATGDTEITLTPSTEASGKVEITAAHATHAAGSANSASTETVEGYSATGIIKIPKITTNAAGHVTAISEETVTIKMPPKDEAGAGEDGATFTPSMSAEGVLSWTNDKDLPNPDPVNLKGPKGDSGKTPVKGEDYMTEADIAEIVERTLNALPAAEEVRL